MFAVAAFLNAFLLFQIQLVIGKQILPWFGGAPSVWTASMMFFQVLLLLGYALAHLFARGRGKARRGFLMVAVLLLSVLVLALQYRGGGVPALPAAAYKPVGANVPLIRILVMLTVTIGAPYIALAAAGPMIQEWYYRAKGDTPYHLYAVSNAGSLAGLLSYPFLIERVVDVQGQAKMWFFAFLLNSALVASVCFFALSRGGSAKTPAEIRLARNRNLGGTAPAPRLRPFLAWTALGAIGSCALLSFTNQISQEIGVIPFLWVLPLTVYLLSFVLTFSSRRLYHRGAFGVTFACLALASAAVMIQPKAFPVLLQIVLFSCALFVLCMVCHGELSCKKPHPEHVTSYYLAIALGGALGAVFVNLAAPILFSGYWEFQLSLFLGGFVLALSVVGEGILPAGRGHTVASLVKRRPVRASLFLSLLAVFALFLALGPLRYYRNSSASYRNFYGVLRVEKKTVETPASDIHFLMHGITTHGFEFTREDLRSVPTCYYGRQSGVGIAFDCFPPGEGRGGRGAPGGGIRVGAIGLGIGTVAAYGEPGDLIEFYEINPKVIELARGAGGYFGYLARSRARTELKEGDARILLEQAVRDGGKDGFYDMLILDAFSSDAVPVHLLTREAFSLYFRVLKENGILAVHTSNRTLAVALQVLRQAFHEDYPAAIILSAGDEYSFGAEWVIMTRNGAFLARREISENLIDPELFLEKYHLSLWTDRHSSLFEIVK